MELVLPGCRILKMKAKPLLSKEVIKTMKAVIDRFEGYYAVVLCGDEEIRVDIPQKLLSQNAREGSWLQVSFELDPVGTKKQKEKVKNLLDKLKNKQS